MRNTPNYNLPQFDGTDKFDKDVLNDAYLKLDEAINDLQETFNLGAGDAGLLSKEVVEARKGKAKLVDKITELEGKDAGFNNFKANGGTIGGDIELNNAKLLNETYDIVLQAKKGKNLKLETLRSDGVPTSLIFIPEGGVEGTFYDCIRPSQDRGGKIDLGHSNNTFKDIYLSGLQKAENGWTKLPNGLILQWGTVKNTTTGNGVNINFPTTFTATPLAVLTTDITADLNQKTNINGYNSAIFNYVSKVAAKSFFWVAIGY